MNSCLRYSKEILKNNSLCLGEDYLKGVLKYVQGFYIVFFGEYRVMKGEISRKECGTYYARSVELFKKSIKHLKEWENIPFFGSRYTTKSFINNSNV